MSNFEKMMTHNQGWADGAASRAMNPHMTNHADVAIRTIYEEGYTMGRADRRKNTDYAAAKFGVTVQKIQLACLRSD